MLPELPDFDTLKEIAERDPAALESFRENLIRSAIMEAPPATRQRLRGLQFQIDCQRRLHTTPLGSCIKISDMMHNSLYHLGDLLNQLTETSTLLPSGNAAAPHSIGKSEDSALEPDTSTATIIPFTRH